MNQARADDYNIRRGKLLSWAQRGRSESKEAIVNDLTEIASAATRVVSLVDSLANTEPSSSGKTLVEIQAWLYDELLEHAASLRPKLEAAVEELYGG